MGAKHSSVRFRVIRSHNAHLCKARTLFATTEERAQIGGERGRFVAPFKRGPFKLVVHYVTG